MSEWRDLTLGRLCEEGGGGIQTGPFGSQLHASDYVSDGVPSVMPQNIGDNRILNHGIAMVSMEDAQRLVKHRLAVGDIVYSRRGDVERRALVRPEDEGSLCGTGCLRVRVGDQNVHDSSFLSYYLGTEDVRAWIVRHAIGATMLNLNTSILSALPLAVPPLQQQRSIAAVLGALDDKIVANDRVVALLESVEDAEARNLVAKAVERLPLNSVASVIKGISYKSSDLVERSRSAMVTLKSIDRSGRFSGRGFKGFEGEYRANQALMIGDVVVAQTDLTQQAEVIGRAVRVPRADSYDRLVVSLDLAVVRPTGGMQREYLLAALRQSEFREHCLARSSGTTVLHLGRGAIDSYELPVAGEEARAAYARRANDRFQLIDALEYENKQLAEARDELLPLLMSGKLRVKDAEKVAEEVL